MLGKRVGHANVPSPAPTAKFSEWNEFRGSFERNFREF